MGFLFLLSGGQDRGDPYLHKPGVLQTVYSGLLLWRGSASPVWSPWHQQQPQWVEGGWLPGWHGVHTWPGRQEMSPVLSYLQAFLPTPDLCSFLPLVLLLSFFKLLHFPTFSGYCPIYYIYQRMIIQICDITYFAKLIIFLSECPHCVGHLYNNCILGTILYSWIC